ncbi:hypothetical protein E5344_03340 [Microbacterium laevaniformans]|uniref:Uncharacterized protein n=1 Tax=Microbacterium laevaniformans TaxID=36807 RepID=A0A4V3RKL4_9MICO|nr:hypothetical protein E5344_03340 [Microbacterium laevaniformans]
MDLDQHTPSLTHLRDFARARANGRKTHVEQDRRQVEAPANDRVFAFAYERLLTGFISYVNAGNTGGALERAVFESSARMRPSYDAAARGMAEFARGFSPTVVTRRQRSVVVTDGDGYELVSLRVHLLIANDERRVGAHVYFSEKLLSDPELAIMDAAVAKAVHQIDPSLEAVIIFARTGSVRFIDPLRSITRGRLTFLRAESLAYRAAWDAAA